VGGIIVSLSNIVTLSSTSDVRLSGLFFFTFAVVVLMLTVASFRHMLSLKWMR
jgi:hypothetical protein